MFSNSPPNVGNNLYASYSSHNILSDAVGGRPTSPFAIGGRSSFISRDFPSSGANTAMGMGNRQLSATVRKGRVGRMAPARLMPLAVDRYGIAD